MKRTKFLPLCVCAPLAFVSACAAPAQTPQTCLVENCGGECGTQACIDRFTAYGRTYRNQTLWTLGDSIFDFNDNSYNDLVQSVASHLGFTKLFTDNIAGSTAAAASSVGIADHLGHNFYGDWQTPDVIWIQRGTNDVYHWRLDHIEKGSASVPDPNTALGSIPYICQTLRGRYPDALIVWSSPLYRADVPQSDLRLFTDALTEVCPRYGVKVFDLGRASGIDDANYTSYLYDGIHPNASGVELLQNVWIDFLRFGDPGRD